MQALSGIRVLDLTIGPVGGMAMTVLADFGAEVLRLRRSDRFAALPAAPMWRRGSQAIELDVARDSARFASLCAGADVLVINWRPATRRAAGLDVQALRHRFPHLVICSITSFGADDPRSELPGYEHVVAAVTGRMLSFTGCPDREGPAFSALQVGVHACTQSVVSGVLAALVARAGHGQGALVETSMLQAFLAYEQGAMMGEQFRVRLGDVVDGVAGAATQAPLPSLHYLPTQAGDGQWVQLGNLLPHLFDNFLVATELVDILADPDYDSAQMNLPEAKRERFRELMFLRMQEKSAAEWIGIFVANGSVVAGPVQSTQEALNDPDILANGHAMPVGDGVQLGPLAKLSATPARPGSGVADGERTAGIWATTPRASVSLVDHGRLPLTGIRVVEIATIIAAPFGASLLAELGAEVIKVEPLAGDAYRGLAGGVGACRVNLGKRSLCVDLKHPEGRTLVQDLLRGSDVLIHNFRPGVPEKLGIDYATLSALNPALVYLQSNGYGPEGPGAHRPSTHPIPGAGMGGVHLQMGGSLPATLLDLQGLRDWSRRIMRANEVNPDPNTALVVASSVLLALMARTHTGRGQSVCVDMFGANAWANADDFLRYPGKPDRAYPDEGQYGLSPVYRLYQCGDGGWIFLALPRDADRDTARGILADAGLAPPDFDDADALGVLFASRPAAFWEARFADTGLACVRADRCLPKQFWLAPEQTAFRAASRHAVWGDFQRPGALVRFDGLPPADLRPPVAGEHTEELLFLVGRTASDVAGLRAAGVVA
ncbi:MAG: CoA transferase [Pseudomonadales bacterium]|nr:CoA transferase [Pseudomonadales bacterium]MCP5185966.1 CoA transferase [Pseudomonadales bacterium]